MQDDLTGAAKHNNFVGTLSFKLAVDAPRNDPARAVARGLGARSKQGENQFEDDCERDENEE
ncbi:MAG: hypothetical protein LC803_10170 [Acidobacteria bacterium]|nr:hypothetical protein [Acidobacteriota bacterium]